MMLEDSCKGDSGAGLFQTVEQRIFVIGIVSFGASGCAATTIPGYNTRVSEYLEWIRDCVQGKC